MDKLIAMRTFVEIVDRGSLTGAAETLGKSLPTVVRMLATLEQHLGVSLLRRTTRRMSLTTEGREYLDRCRHILSDVEEAEAALGSQPGAPSGKLRMTAPVLFGQMHVAPVVIDFVERYPNVSVDLQLLDRVVDLVEEGLDVALRITPLADSSMIAIPVGSVRRVCVASPALLERFGAPTHPAELSDRPCVLFGGLAPAQMWRFRKGERELAVRPTGSFSSNHGGAALEACAEGLGFGSFFCYQVGPLVSAGRLSVVLSEYEPPPVPISLVYNERRLVSTRLRIFLDWMRDRLRQRQQLEI